MCGVAAANNERTRPGKRDQVRTRLTHRRLVFYSADERCSAPTSIQQVRIREVFVLSRQGAVGHRESYSLAFVVLVAVFVTTLISANITAVKLVEVFGFVLPAAVIVFPISYICGDVLTEV